MRWNTCDADNNNPRTGSVRSTLWKQTAAAGHRSMSYKKGRLVLPPPVTDIVESTVSISSLSSGDTGKYSVSAATMTAQQNNKNQLHHHQKHPTTATKKPSSSSLLHHRKPPIPEEEVVLQHHHHHQHPSRVLRHRIKSNNNNKKQTMLFQRRDILRLVDRDKDDEHSLCSRDLDIKSAASSKVALAFAAPSTTERQQQFVDLESCISDTSSCGYEKRQEEAGGDPPGHKNACLQSATSQDPLLNLDRLLLVLEEEEDDDDNDEDDEPAQPEKQQTHAMARLKRNSGEKHSSSLLQQETSAKQGETTQGEPAARLKIDKMESTNERANRLPVVCAQSLAPTQAQRLDWTTITNGHTVLEKDDAESSVPFDERRARKLQEKQASERKAENGLVGDGMVVVDEEEIIVVDEEMQNGVSVFPDSVSKYDAEEDTTSPQASIELRKVTSWDVTEKAGTNRKKLMDIKNIGAPRTTTTTEMDEIEKFCGMLGNMFTTCLCD